MEDLKILGWILAGNGVGFTFFAFIFYLISNRLKSNGLEVNGKIVGYTSQVFWQFNKERAIELGLSDFDSSILDILKQVTRCSANTFHTVYRYAVNGVVYTKATMTSSSKFLIKVGKDIVVRYNPDNPFDSVIANNMALKILYIVFFIVGILFSIAGIVLLILGFLM